VGKWFIMAAFFQIRPRSRGGKTGEMRDYFYGATRPGLAGTGLPTDRHFTSQRDEPSLDCYDYGARSHDHLPSPALHEKFPRGFPSPPRFCREAV